MIVVTFVAVYLLGALVTAYTILVVSKVQKWEYYNTNPALVLGTSLWPLLWTLLGPVLLARKLLDVLDAKAQQHADRIRKKSA